MPLQSPLLSINKYQMRTVSQWGVSQPTASPIGTTPYQKQLVHMMRQVDQCLTQLLGKLEYIYSCNGLCFSIRKYHEVLVRMLSPFELGSQFGLNKNEKYFQDYKREEERKQRQRVQKERQDKMNSLKKRRLETISKQKRFYELPTTNATTTANDTTTSLSDTLKILAKPKTKLGRSPVINGKAQQQLCQWVFEQLKKRRLVKNRQIVDRARSIANNDTFVGSKNWVKRFWRRHELLKQMMESIRNKTAFIFDVNNVEVRKQLTQAYEGMPNMSLRSVKQEQLSQDQQQSVDWNTDENGGLNKASSSSSSSSESEKDEAYIYEQQSEISSAEPSKMKKAYNNRAKNEQKQANPATKDQEQSEQQ